MIIIRLQLALTGIRPIGKVSEIIWDIPIAAKLLLLFLLFTILSSILSGYDGTLIGVFRREGLLSISIYVLSCILLSKYFSPKKWMLYLFGVSTLLFCALSIIQLTGANPFQLYPEGYNYYDSGVYYVGEYLGTIGNAALSAAFLSLATGVLAMSLIKMEFKERWFLAIPLFFTVFLLLKMNVDAGILALAVGLVLMLPVAVTDQRSLSCTLFVYALIAAAFTLSRVLILGNGFISFRPDRLVLLIIPGGAALLAGT